MSEAARQGDPIAHSSALGGLLTGLAVGAAAALAGVAIVGTGGLAAVAVVGAVAAGGAGVGELIGSMSFCTSDAGQITEGSNNVFINSRPAARASLSAVVCDKHSPPQLVAQGSSSVYINGMPAARVGDRSTCDGKISAGSSNVFIGGDTLQTEDIAPEVPVWLHRAVFALGIGSAIALGAGPGLIVLGLAGGIVGGEVGHRLGGEWFGEGSDGQKLMAFGSAILGGAALGRGGMKLDARFQIKFEGLGSNFGNLRIVRRPENTFTATLRGKQIELPGVRSERFAYTKRAASERETLRAEFNRSARADYLKSISDSSEKVAALKQHGLADADIIRIQNGQPPKGWQVHHVRPLDDGGTNAFENLTLIKNDPYHLAITNTQNSLARGMRHGETRIVDWPMIDSDIYPPIF